MEHSDDDHPIYADIPEQEEVEEALEELISSINGSVKYSEEFENALSDLEA